VPTLVVILTLITSPEKSWLLDWQYCPDAAPDWTIVIVPEAPLLSETPVAVSSSPFVEAVHVLSVPVISVLPVAKVATCNVPLNPLLLPSSVIVIEPSVTATAPTFLTTNTSCELS